MTCRYRVASNNGELSFRQSGLDVDKSVVTSFASAKFVLVRKSQTYLFV